MKKAILLLLSCIALLAQELTILTEELPPHQYEKNGEAKGMGVATVKAIQKIVGNSDKIVIDSWHRAYNLALSNPNHMIFSTARLKEREHLFKWVGPIIMDESYFYENKDAPTGIKTIEDAKELGLISAGSKVNAGYIKLASLGFRNLSDIDPNSMPLLPVIHKRADLAVGGDSLVAFMIKKHNMPEGKIVNTGVLVYSRALFIAFSKETPNETVQKWQNAFDSLKNSGELDRIQKSAIKEAYEDFGITDTSSPSLKQ